VPKVVGPSSLVPARERVRGPTLWDDPSASAAEVACRLAWRRRRRVPSPTRILFAALRRGACGPRSENWRPTCGRCAQKRNRTWLGARRGGRRRPSERWLLGALDSRTRPRAKREKDRGCFCRPPSHGQGDHRHLSRFPVTPGDRGAQVARTCTRQGDPGTARGWGPGAMCGGGNGGP